MQCSGPIGRRSFLRIGALSFGGLALSDLLRLRAAETAQPAANTSVIFLWLAGGPSQLETYDLKPDAPSEIRGEFRPIRTVVPGLEICEHFPQQARIADKLAVIRSIQPNYQDHGPGTWRFLSGRLQPLSASDGPSQFPEIGSIVAWARRNRHSALPQFISQQRTFRQGNGYLGSAYAPFMIGGASPPYPDEADFKVQNMSLLPDLAHRLDDRVHLLQCFDKMRRDLDLSGSMSAVDGFNRQAVDLLTSGEVRKAFDLTLESKTTRDRYGWHHWGQSALLARRLAEAGCGLIHVNLGSIYKSGMYNGYADNWDDHSEAARGNMFDAMRRRLPVLDYTVAALIEDIYQRGQHKNIMVVVTGEFGRTPRITNRSGRPGRDHWGGSMSVVVSGGGVNTGQVIGSTNAWGEEPRSRKLDPNDLLATIYQFLGINPAQAIPDSTGRPMAILPYGTPIAELL